MKRQRLVDKYLNLLKSSILNEIYLENELRILYLKDCLFRRDEYSYETEHDIHKIYHDRFTALQNANEKGAFLESNVENLGYRLSMIGRSRMDNLWESLDHIRKEGVEGDVMECGVWRGGASIFMAGYLDIYEITDKRVFVVDSFEGVPKSEHELDLCIDLHKEAMPQLAVDLETVKSNFRKFGLLNDNVSFVKGWFRDTLTTDLTEKIALLRLDGDLYESTMSCLINLYDKVSEGGVVIVDDYNVLPQCKKAVHDFFQQIDSALPNIMEIDWTGVFWVKESD